MADDYNFLTSRCKYDRSAAWFESLKRYVQETNVTAIDLSSMQLKTEEVALVLEFLAKSEVMELNLSHNYLGNGIQTFVELLRNTRIKRLKLDTCFLLEDETLSLVKHLKDTEITDLNLWNNILRLDNVDAVAKYLSRSRLTALNVGNCAYFSCREDAALFSRFFELLGTTSITHLNLSGVFRMHKCPDVLISWFRNLKDTSITYLNLTGNNVGCCDLRQLDDSLRCSKLIELDLSNNEIDDDGVDAIMEALIGTKIITLNLASNTFYGSNNLGSFLKKTQIMNLDLSNNTIIYTDMFSLPNFLSGSSVVSLKLSSFGDGIGELILSSLKFSELLQLDISHNLRCRNVLAHLVPIIKHTIVRNLNISHCRYVSGWMSTFVLFGEALVESKVESFDFSGLNIFAEGSATQLAFSTFLERIKDSPVTFLKMRFNNIDEIGAGIISPSLVSTHITHLDLGHNLIGLGDGIQNFASNLKFTGITHLCLENNEIDDEGAEALAASLKGTQLIDLNLNRNLIRDRGAIALALSLKDSIISCLYLQGNIITSHGLEVLADRAKDTLITVLEACQNPEKPWDASPVETVIWNNRRLVYHFLHYFKQIAPKSGENVFRFNELASTTNVDLFLEESLCVYKLAIEQPSAASILSREGTKMSRDQIVELLLSEFPKQFVWFIARKIEADSLEHVRFLQRAEELGLNRIVELLLLNRPLYFINESNGILHPFVYLMLNKYKFPLCNTDIEPEGLMRISRYFLDFPDLEGASDVIDMLKDLDGDSEKQQHS